MTNDLLESKRMQDKAKELKKSYKLLKAQSEDAQLIVKYEPETSNNHQTPTLSNENYQQQTKMKLQGKIIQINTA